MGRQDETTGIFGNASVDGLFLQVFLNNPGNATFNSSETFKLNHIFGPSLIVGTLAEQYEKDVAGTSQRSDDVCGNVWFANVPNTYGLASAGHAETVTDIYSAMFLPQITKGDTTFMDLSSAAPLLFGTDELKSSDYPNVTENFYWQPIGGLTKADVQSGNYYPELDFSACYEIARTSFNATNGSARDGSGLGVKLTNMHDLVLSNVTLRNPNENSTRMTADNNLYSGTSKRTLGDLVKMISDISYIGGEDGGLSAATHYAAFPRAAADSSTKAPLQSQVSRGCISLNDASQTPLNRFVSDVSDGLCKAKVNGVDISTCVYGSNAQQTADIYLMKTNYLKPMTAKLVDLNKVVPNLDWKDIYDLEGFGLNMLSEAGSASQKSSLASAIGANTDDVKDRFATTYTTSAGTTTPAIGHSAEMGLLDQLMRQPSVEMAPQQDGSGDLIKNAPKVDGVSLSSDMSNAYAYLRLIKLKEMGVTIDTILNWRSEKKGAVTYLNDLSSSTYNFVGLPRGISGGTVKRAFNTSGTAYGLANKSIVGGFCDFSGLSGVAVDSTTSTKERVNVEDLPWDYTLACKAAYPDSNIFEGLSVYDITTHMGQDDVVWSRLPASGVTSGIYQRMDMCLNNTGVGADDLNYATSTASTCKATDILKVYDSLKTFGPLSVNTPTAAANEGYVHYAPIYRDISMTGLYPNGKNSTQATAYTGTASGVVGGRDTLSVVAYQDISGTTSLHGGVVPPGTVAYTTQSVAYNAQLMNNLVPTTFIEEYSRCPNITADNVNTVLDVWASIFTPLNTSTGIVGGYSDASSLLVASTPIGGTTGVNVNLATAGFSISDMSMSLVKQFYQKVWPNATNVELANKILLDNYTTAQGNAETNTAINMLLDNGFVVDDIVQLNPGNWNAGSQIGDTIGVYATATDTSIGRSQAIANAFASNATIAAQFFDDISLNQSLTYPNTSGASATEVAPNTQEKADMVDFLLFFDVAQDKIWNMMGANDYTRTYWLKNWFNNTRQADMSYSSMYSPNTSALASNYASPQSYIVGASELIQKVSVTDWASDPNFGVSYPGWGSYKATNSSWMLAYEPYQLKHAGIACEGVITSCITTGYIIDSTTLAIEPTMKCAFTQDHLKRAGPNGEPGYTQDEINAAIGAF
tara:strand:+ start:2632 stop:6075 length:3444 start_codon:yes stop_codon:yes gene_type:complete